MITENSTHPVDYYGPVKSQPLEEGTTHVSIIGPNGDAVAVTGTINEWYVSLRHSFLFGQLLWHKTRAFIPFFHFFIHCFKHFFYSLVVLISRNFFKL